MLLKWLSRMISGLLVASLCGLVVSTVVSQTLINSRYLEAELTKANGYNRLSDALTSEISRQAGAADNPLVTAAIHNVVTPAVLKQKINTALDQLARYYQGKGPAPTVSLADLVTQTQAAGVPLPADSDLRKPIKLVPDSGTDSTVTYPAKSFVDTHATAIIASVLLALVLAVISWQRRRYEALPDVLISVGVLVGALALALYLASNAADHYVKFSAASNVFASLGRDMAEDIVRDLARRFAIIAGACLVVGIVLRVAVAKTRSKPMRAVPVKVSPKRLSS
jgi:multisubunit Na+/H+ antiporter MnhB subunit